MSESLARNTQRPGTALLLLLALALWPAQPGRAQTNELTDRLPPDTLFYVYWRGAGSLGSENSNALVALWNDPGFAPARHILEQQLAEGAARNPRLARISADQWQALLANPLLFGARLGQATNGAKPKGQGFLIVSAQGKAAENARAVLAAAGPEAAATAKLTAASYLVSSRDPATLDDLVRRFGAASPAVADTLAALPAYHDARRELDGRPALEIFLRVPDLSKLPPAAAPNFNVAAFVRELHLERIHVLCGGLDLRSPAAVARFSILGDTTPGSPLDLFGSNADTFATLAAAPARASINVARLDFGALVSDFLNAFSAAATEDRAAQVKMMAGLVTGSVLPALGGEYAEIWVNPQSQAGENPPLVALTIRQTDAANQLFQNVLAPFVKPVGQEGQIRYFHVNPGKQALASQSGNVNVAMEPDFLALTPGFLLGSKNEQLVRERAAAVVSGSTGGLAADPGFRAARAELPAELSGLSYFDFERFDWLKWVQQTAAQMAKDPHSKDRATELAAWAQAGGAAVYARHLHQLVLGSWKDGQGIHWRGYLH
jgi:hypothetical protein